MSDDVSNLTWEKVQAAIAQLPTQDDRIIFLKEQYPISARHFGYIVRDLGLEFTCGCSNNPEVLAFRARGLQLVCCICMGKEGLTNG